MEISCEFCPSPDTSGNPDSVLNEIGYGGTIHIRIAGKPVIWKDYL